MCVWVFELDPQIAVFCPDVLLGSGDLLGCFDSREGHDLAEWSLSPPILGLDSELYLAYNFFQVYILLTVQWHVYRRFPGGLVTCLLYHPVLYVILLNSGVTRICFISKQRRPPQPCYVSHRAWSSFDGQICHRTRDILHVSMFTIRCLPRSIRPADCITSANLSPNWRP